MINFYKTLKTSTEESSTRVQHVRDLTIMEISNGIKLVVTCDSDGGIGSKDMDLVKVPGQILGRFAVRVPLMEMFAAGAIPTVVVDTLAVEMDPSGRDIIEGVRKELTLVGLDADGMLTGSTEDNVPTIQTGVGVVVIGFVSEADFKPGTSEEGDIVISIGNPKSAPDDEVDLDDPEIANTICVKKLAALEYIHDILPVGSKGIIHEQAELAKSAKLTFNQRTDLGVDIYKSAGPSTCVLTSLPEAHLSQLEAVISEPISIIGMLTKRI